MQLGINKNVRHIVVVVLTFFGLVILGRLLFNAHVYWQTKNAVLLYDKLVDLAKDQDKDQIVANNIEKTLTTKYKYTVYGLLAKLSMAHNEVLNENFGQAEEHLQWVIKHHKNNILLPLVKLRLGRIYLQQNKAKELQELINQEIKHTTPLKSFYYELRGDLAKAEDNVKLAVDSYQEAIDSSISEQEKLLFTTKLADLPA